MGPVWRIVSVAMLAPAPSAATAWMPVDRTPGAADSHVNDSPGRHSLTIQIALGNPGWRTSAEPPGPSVAPGDADPASVIAIDSIDAVHVCHRSTSDTTCHTTEAGASIRMLRSYSMPPTLPRTCTIWYMSSDTVGTGTDTVEIAGTGATPAAPRDRLLEAVIEYGGRHGLADTSLRTLAKSVGTSHRMLLHHFGSRDQLLVAVVHEVERRQQESLMDLADADAPEIARAAIDRTAVGRMFWDRLADPSLAPLERLFFELYSQALLGAPWADTFLDGIVDSWVAPVAELLVADGVDRDTAMARARLGVAVSRGLLLDLLATGDHAAVDAAMDEFLAMSR